MEKDNLQEVQALDEKELQTVTGGGRSSGRYYPRNNVDDSFTNTELQKGNFDKANVEAQKSQATVKSYGKWGLNSRLSVDTGWTKPLTKMRG